MDSNHRRRKPADLQSAPVGHLGNLPSSLIAAAFRWFHAQLDPGVVSRTNCFMPNTAEHVSSGSRKKSLQSWCDERRRSALLPYTPLFRSGWLLVHIPFSVLLLVFTAWHAI